MGKSISGARNWVAAADAATWYCSAVIVALVLLSSFGGGSWYDGEEGSFGGGTSLSTDRPCEEIYVVGEGETLNTISDKCRDPFIVERNPHIQDPDDVFPGLVIKITPLTLNPNPNPQQQYEGVEVAFATRKFKLEG